MRAGLSYSTFKLSCSAGADDDEGSALVIAGATAAPTTVTCQVSLASGPAGEEVLMVFHRVGAAIKAAAKHPVPMKELVGFERVHVSSGTAGSAEFKIGPNQMGLVDAKGNKQLVKGEHHLDITNGVELTWSKTVTVAEAAVLVTVPPMPAPSA